MPNNITNTTEETFRLLGDLGSVVDDVREIATELNPEASDLPAAELPGAIRENLNDQQSQFRKELNAMQTTLTDVEARVTELEGTATDAQTTATAAKNTADAAQKTASSASATASTANTKASKASDSATAAYERALAEMHTHLLCEHTDYGQPTSLANKFAKDTQLLRFPKMDTSKCTNFGGCCSGCTNLEEIPEDIDFSAATTLASAFCNGPSIKRFAGGNTSKCTSFAYFLQYAGDPEEDRMTYYGDIDTSNATNLSNLFYGHGNLVRYPTTIDMRKCTRAQQVFDGNYSLTLDNMPTLIPPEQPCDAHMMFLNCKGLAGLPFGGDFSWATEVWFLFDGCLSLTNIGDLDISSATSSVGFFQSCLNLETAGTVTLYGKSEPFQVGDNFIDIQDKRTPPAKLRQITFRNLGNVINSSSATSAVAININYPAWGSVDEAARQSLVDSLRTYSIDRAAKGWGVCRLGLPAAVIARLTNEEKAAITAKGYSLVTYS